MTTPVVPTARGRGLAGLILAQSGRAGLGPGSRLPTERQLAVDLGVTRSGIRLALAALEADGFISREVGRGTFLRDTAAAPGRRARRSAARSNQPSPAGARVSLAASAGAGGSDFAPADVMTIRRLIEPQALPLVVFWATASDFGGDGALPGRRRRGRHLRGVRGLGPGAAPVHHRRRAQPAARRALRRSSRPGTARSGATSSAAARPASAARYPGGPPAVVAALRARDSRQAVEAMRMHLSRVACLHLLGETH